MGYHNKDFDIKINLPDFGVIWKSFFPFKDITTLKIVRHWINEENDTVYIIVELPGFSKENIELLADEEKVVIKAQRNAFPAEKVAKALHDDLIKIRLEIPLKAKVNPQSAKAIMRNGLLLIQLKKKEIGMKIPLE